MLKPEVLQWFRQLQVALREQFQLDTTKKEDIGRLRLCRITHQLRPNGKKLVVPLHEIPKQITDEKGSVIPFEVTPLYAFVECGAGDEPYEVPMPQDEQALERWMLEQQAPFNVREKPDGRLFIETDLSDDQLNKIYDNAKDGRLYVTHPGGSVTMPDDNIPQFVSVSSSGTEPCFLSLCKSRTTDLPPEEYKKFYKRHPEFLTKPVTDTAALTTAALETTDYAKTSEPDYLLDRVESIHETLRRAVTDEDAVKQDAFERYYWQTLHMGLAPMKRSDFWFYLTSFSNLLTGELELDSGYADGDGLENYFIRGENGALTPLFPDRDALRSRLETDPTRTQYEIRARLSSALDGSGLYVHGPKNSDPESTVTALLKRRADGTVDTVRLDQPKPKAAALWQKILHFIFRFPFRKECAREEELEQLFRTAGADCTQMEALRNQLAGRPVSPKKAALDNVMTEEQFRYKLATGILYARRKTTNAAVYLSLIGKSEADVVREPIFQEFLHTPAAQAVREKVLSGTEVSMGGLCTSFLKFEKEKAEAAKKQTGNGKKFSDVHGGISVEEEEQPKLSSVLPS